MTPEPLTEREREVLFLISRGHQNPTIAEALSVAPDTVRTHAERIRRKLGAKTRAHAVAIACHLDLLEGDPRGSTTGRDEPRR